MSTNFTYLFIVSALSLLYINFTRRSIKNMFAFLFGSAPTRFEVLRTQLTQPQACAPSTPQLNGISEETQVIEFIQILAGSNKQIRSQIAYASLISKMLHSENIDNWIYQLKHLIILDRLADEHLFCHDVGGLHLHFTNSLPLLFYEGVNTQNLVEVYWRLVRYGAQIMDSDNHVICYKRSHRSIFLKKLNLKELINQTQILESLFRLALLMVVQLRGNRKISEADELYKNELVRFLLVTIMRKLLLFYSCELQVCRAVLDVLQEVEERDLRAIKKMCAKFQANSFAFVQFLQDFRFVKGFEEFNYHQLNPFQDINLPALAGELIFQKDDQRHKKRLSQLTLPTMSNLNVEPLINGEQTQKLNPRLVLPTPSERKSHCTSFLDWNNHFSEQFPPKEVMTDDIIRALRGEEEEQEDEIVVYDLSNSGVSYADFSVSTEEPDDSRPNLEETRSNIANLSYHSSTVIKAHQQPTIINIYSNLQAKWNQV